MDFSKFVFVEFVKTLSDMFRNVTYNEYDLAYVASYFWEKVEGYIQQEYKSEAKRQNATRHLHGRKKKRGFWLFALHLERSLLAHDTNSFHVMWEQLTPEWREYWVGLYADLIESEIKRVIV
jgi:hypothetical protein